MIIENEQIELFNDAEEQVCFVVDNWPISDKRLLAIKSATEEDPILTGVIDQVRNGWPTSAWNLPECIRDFFQYKEKLSLYHDILVFEDRVVIPFSMRSEILDKIHSGHQGITKCRARAKESVWWPRLSIQLEDLIVNYSR